MIAYLDHLGKAIGAVGVAVVAYGVLRAAAQFVRAEWYSAGGANVEQRRHELRHELGYYLLLSLELLIAADIIDTLVTPGLEELAGLAGIVAIRTAISWTLNAELRSAARTGHGPVSLQCQSPELST